MLFRSGEREKEEDSIKGVFETLYSSSSPPTAVPCLSEHPEPEGRAGRKDIEMEGLVKGVKGGRVEGRMGWINESGGKRLSGQRRGGLIDE